MFRTLPLRFTTLLCLCVLPAGSLLAGALEMKNGDVITGTITKVTADKVFIDPEYADEFAVQRTDVLTIRGGQDFEVELADGSIVKGHLDLDDQGNQLVVTESGSKLVAITDVVSAAAPEPYYERSSQVDLNAAFNSGNTDSRNVLLYANTAMRFGDHRHLAELTFRRDEVDGIDTKKQDLLTYQYNWMFRDPWYVGIDASYERDPIRALSNRFVLGGIIGRDVFDRDGRFLTINGGFGYSREKIGGVSESGLVGLWNLLYRQDLWKSIKFFHDHNLTYQFYENNNTIFKSNTGLQFDLLKNVYGTLSLRYDYETEPAAGFSKDDTTLAVGIGTKF